MEVFSTQASVEARANSYRLKLWTDKNKDGTPDPATLTQGFEFATSTIFEHVQQRYGETEINSWTISDAPPKVLRYSDDLCLWYFSSGNNSQNPLIQAIYDTVIESLESIRDGQNSLYGATESVTTMFCTEPLDNPFEDTVYFNNG